MKKVHLGKGLDFDALELATSVWTCFGMRGSGKSTTAGVIVEGLMDAGIQVVVLDPVGIWFSLRLDRDGKTPSRFKIAVLGGAHGDIPLAPGGGRQVAEALVASKSSAVLDVSRGMRKAERTRFVADFAEALFEAKKDSPSALCLVCEEAQWVVPQLVRSPTPDISRCMSALDEIGSVGRNHGLGMGLLSPRPQKVWVDLRNLSETGFYFRMVGIHERKAVQEWVREKGAEGRDDVAGELPSIPRHEAIVWSPGLFDIYGQFKMSPKTTYDASSTPGAGRVEVVTKPLDLQALGAAMTKVVEEAKANDPRALRVQIADLQRQLAAKTAPAGAPAKAGKPEVRIEYRCPKEIRRLFDLDLGKVEIGAAALRKQVDDGLGKLMALITDARARGLGVIGSFPEMGVAAGIRDSTPRAPAGYVPNPERVQRPRVGPSSDAGQAKGGADRMLRALAETLKDGLSRRELGALSDLKSTTGTFDTYLSRLRQEGLIENGGAGIRITETGRARVGPVEQRTGKELLDHWMPRLGGKPAAMLEVLFESTGPVDRHTLGEAVALKSDTGTFDTYLSRLVSRGLIDRVGKGVFAVAEVFRQ